MSSAFRPAVAAAPPSAALLAALSLRLLLAVPCEEADAAASEAPASPERAASREDVGQSWFDPVVGERVGLFNPVRDRKVDETKMLESLGYLAGYEQGKGPSGVPVYDRQRAQPGYNLYVSGHAPEARLMDMAGETLHVWRYEFRVACPEQVESAQSGQRWFRRARLLPGGELLALFDYAGLVKLDRDSRLLWASCDAYHHDFDLDAQGRILALKAGFQPVPVRSPLEILMADYVELLTAEGVPTQLWSVPKAIVAGSRTDLLQRVHRPDAFHTNSVSLLTGAGTRADGPLRPAQLLLSMRNIDALATLDPAQERISWALTGSFRAQHEARLLASGRVLLFDNLGRGGRSRVIELDPRSGEIAWSYPGPEGDLYSPVCGTSRRLANGNTLIAESTAGRALEVTREREVVWEFRSPHRVRREGKVLVALLGDLVRVSREEVDAWLTRPPAASATSRTPTMGTVEPYEHGGAGR